MGGCGIRAHKKKPHARLECRGLLNISGVIRNARDSLLARKHLGGTSRELLKAQVILGVLTAAVLHHAHRQNDPALIQQLLSLPLCRDGLQLLSVFNSHLLIPVLITLTAEYDFSFIDYFLIDYSPHYRSRRLFRWSWLYMTTRPRWPIFRFHF